MKNEKHIAVVQESEDTIHCRPELRYRVHLEIGENAFVYNGWDLRA